MGRTDNGDDAAGGDAQLHAQMVCGVGAVVWSEACGQGPATIILAMCPQFAGKQLLEPVLTSAARLHHLYGAARLNRSLLVQFVDEC